MKKGSILGNYSNLAMSSDNHYFNWEAFGPCLFKKCQLVCAEVFEVGENQILDAFRCYFLTIFFFFKL